MSGAEDLSASSFEYFRLREQPRSRAFKVEPNIP